MASMEASLSIMRATKNKTGIREAQTRGLLSITKEIIGLKITLNMVEEVRKITKIHIIKMDINSKHKCIIRGAIIRINTTTARTTLSLIKSTRIKIKMTTVNRIMVLKVRP